MELFKTVVSLVTGLAWPVAIVWIVLAFRGEIRGVLRSRKATVKAGPFELAIEQARVETEAATATRRPSESAKDGSDPAASGIDESLSHIAVRAESDPAGAMLAAFEVMERALQDKLDAADIDLSGVRGGRYG